MIRRVAAVFAFLVVASGWLLAQDSPLPGPAGGFSGGTVTGATTFTSPVVLTGDNAGGVGTLRIRPADEDTQVVLCEASNNAATEMCSAFQHLNSSATQSYGGFGTNLYFDTSSVAQRYWTSAGFGRVYTGASSTAAGNEAGLQVFGTGGAEAGRVALQASAAAASTLFVGVGGTVTTDIRGPILNGGSATCGGLFAGSLCSTDTIVAQVAAAPLHYYASTDTTSYAGISMATSAGSSAFSIILGGATNADADYADKSLVTSLSKVISIARTDNVADASIHTEWADNISATGVKLMDLLGNGTVRPLLYGSQSNCSDGAGAAACSAAPAGSVVIDAGATTVVVSTTAVTANSQIFVQDDSSLGTKLGVTCNTAAFRDYRVSARTAATSFTITTSAAPVTNPACLSYSIIN